MFCTKCGKKVIDGDRFCAYCGTPVRSQEPHGYEDVVFNPPFKVEAQKRTDEILKSRQEEELVGFRTKTDEQIREEQRQARARRESVNFSWNVEGYPTENSSSRKQESEFNWDSVLESRDYRPAKPVSVEKILPDDGLMFRTENKQTTQRPVEKIQWDDTSIFHPENRQPEEKIQWDDTSMFHSEPKAPAERVKADDNMFKSGNTVQVEKVRTSGDDNMFKTPEKPKTKASPLNMVWDTAMVSLGKSTYRPTPKKVDIPPVYVEEIVSAAAPTLMVNSYDVSEGPMSIEDLEHELFGITAEGEETRVPVPETGTMIYKAVVEDATIPVEPVSDNDESVAADEDDDILGQLEDFIPSTPYSPDMTQVMDAVSEETEQENAEGKEEVSDDDIAKVLAMATASAAAMGIAGGTAMAAEEAVPDDSVDDFEEMFSGLDAVDAAMTLQEASDAENDEAIDNLLRKIITGSDDEADTSALEEILIDHEPLEETSRFAGDNKFNTLYGNMDEFEMLLEKERLKMQAMKDNYDKDKAALDDYTWIGEVFPEIRETGASTKTAVNVPQNTPETASAVGSAAAASTLAETAGAAEQKPVSAAGDAKAAGEMKAQEQEKEAEKEAKKEEPKKEEKAVPQEKKAETEKAGERASLDDLFGDEEFEDEKSHGLRKFIVFIIVLALLLVGAEEAVRYFIPDSVPGQWIDANIPSVMEVVDRIRGTEDQEIVQEEPADTPELTEEEAALLYMETMVSDAAEGVTTIGQVTYSGTLKFSDIKKPAFEEVAEAAEFEDSDWYVNDAGETVTYCEKIVSAIITHYDNWQTMNDNEALLGINHLAIGEIREADGCYYVLCQLDFANNEETETRAYETLSLAAADSAIVINEIREENN